MKKKDLRCCGNCIYSRTEKGTGILKCYVSILKYNGTRTGLLEKGVICQEYEYDNLVVKVGYVDWSEDEKNNN
jgi:hypothetical protein